MNDHDHPYFSFPMMVPHYPRPGEGYHANDAPVRVRVALEFLNDLTQKATVVEKGGGPFGDSVRHDAVELLPVEHKAQAAACEMLAAYFRGELLPSAWEMDLLSRSQMVKIVSVPCGYCENDPKKRKTCPECRGHGKVLVQP